MRKADLLEFATLGVLQDGPAHGYELRKRLTAALGTLQTISFGSLYPALQDLVRQGLIAEQVDDEAPRRTRRTTGRAGEGATALATAPESAGARRNRITYRLTEAGAQRFASMLADAGPNAWDDEGFRVHFAFFARAEQTTRTSILEGRRMRLAERRALMREALTRAAERVDAYTLELQRHGLENVEHEMRWLDTLLAQEQHH